MKICLYIFVRLSLFDVSTLPLYLHPHQIKIDFIYTVDGDTSPSIMSSSPEPEQKRRKFNTSDSTAPNSKFKAGNIIRLRVWNFTTYNYGVFHLSPSLNMIIGPNGTGKSTFVAAVCLVLGGKIDLIRRKSTDSMIKSGEKQSTIEIVLSAGEDKPTITIERVITLKLTKSQWKINGSSSDATKVSNIVKRLNIQLDNLCHFLPQERVAEFASLSPEKLLLEMERTIGDNTLLEKHQLLIDLDQSLVEVSAKVESAEEYINALKEDVGTYAREAERFQEYEEKTKEIGYHKKLLPYAKLQDLKNLMASLKLVRDRAKQALEEFHKNIDPLRKHAEDAVNLTKILEEELSRIGRKVAQLTLLLSSKAEDLSSDQLKIKECQNKIDNLRSRTKNQKLELQKTIEEKEKITSKLQATQPVDSTQLASLEEQRQEKYDVKSKIEEELDSFKLQATSLTKEIELNEQRLREERKKLDSNDRLEVLRSTGTRYRRELMEMSYKAHLLLRREKQSKGLKYYEAPIISCRVTDVRFAKYFEKIVDNMSLFALYFENDLLYQEVSAILPKDLNVPMRVLSRREPDDKLPRDQLKRLGFDGCLSDFVTGPEPVIRALKQKCFIHMIPVALRAMSEELIQKFIDYITLRPGFKNARFAVENTMFLVTRSKHGSRQTLYQTEHISEAQLMAAEGLTEDIKREIQKRLWTLKEKIAASTERRDIAVTSKDEFLKKKVLADEELRELDNEVRVLKKQKESKARLEDMLRHTESKIESLRKSTTEDYGEQIVESESELIEIYLASSKKVAANAALTEDLANHKMKVKKIELLRQQEENRALTFQSLLREMDKKKELLQEKYREAKSKYDEHKKGDAVKEIKQQNLEGEEREFVKQLAEKYQSQQLLTELFVLQTIERLEDEISVLANVDHGTMALLKTKRADLDVAEKQLPEMQRKKGDLETRIANIHGPWEEELSTIVENISRTFQKKFVAVASDGQVELRKAERYRDWKLEILVKFRENTELKVLDHQSQSGGERAVSTIFFIMSLQGLTNAPIRIVDEINQGMDPKNEKMTHKYLVNTACTSDSSQYFLVTPKLLTGLFYHPDMAVHCIFTGPYLQGGGAESGNEGILNMPLKYNVAA